MTCFTVRIQDITYYAQISYMWGAKFAPGYATLVIGYLEKIWYDEINVKYGVQFTNEFVKNWKRILDDFFIHGQNQNKNY